MYLSIICAEFPRKLIYTSHLDIGDNSLYDIFLCMRETVGSKLPLGPNSKCLHSCFLIYLKLTRFSLGFFFVMTALVLLASLNP
jgi:hypothetical protein